MYNIKIEDKNISRLNNSKYKFLKIYYKIHNS